MIRFLGVGLLLLWAESAGQAQTSLPRVQEVEWESLRDRCRQLATTLRKLDALPTDIDKQLTALLKDDVKDSDAALEKLQDLLDPLCLIGVHINPESRVKAARGLASTELTRDRPRIVLLKVQNEGGITPPLSVSGDELRLADQKGEGRWLEAVVSPSPLPKTLSGRKLEYVALRLTARESGKREATLKFDAGQGTQDLGFRAEVPILFRIAPR
jgi:hypothetical protein